MLIGGAEVLLDSGDEALITGYLWYILKRPHTCYVYGRKAGSPKLIYLHRLLTEAPRGLDVDHINGNGLDNRRSNLRIATRSQNLQNKRSKTPGFKGVRKRDDCVRWEARIGSKTLGMFDIEIDAAKAYDAAAKSLYGEFAKTNFEV